MSEATANDVQVEVANSDLDRSYWIARPWISPASAAALQDADVLVVPWENYRQNRATLFPEGTSDIVRHLSRELVIGVAIDRDKYEEIALYADAWRLPTLVCTYAIIPLLVNLLSNEVDRHFISNQEGTPVSVELIVEGSAGRCVSIKYKGPANKLPDELLKQVGSCFPKADEHSYAAPARSKVPLTRKGQSARPGGSKR